MSTRTQSGRTAIVTGGSRGIGAAVARKLVEDGANVVINYVNNDRAAEHIVNALNSIRPGSVTVIKADVSKPADVNEIVEHALKTFGKIDIVIANAAVIESKVLADVDENHYNLLFDINVKGSIFLAKAVAPYLYAGSRILFFSTGGTMSSTIPTDLLVYIATKGAVEQVTRILAKDLGTRGITVNCISPGPTETELLRGGQSPEQIALVAGLAPEKRIGQPSEIAEAVSFLCSPAASWVNGQVLHVNGGAFV